MNKTNLLVIYNMNTHNNMKMVNDSVNKDALNFNLNSPRNLANLPQELINQILGRVDTRTIQNCTSVSSRWKEVTNRCIFEGITHSLHRIRGIFKQIFGEKYSHGWENIASFLTESPSWGSLKENRKFLDQIAMKMAQGFTGISTEELKTFNNQLIIKKSLLSQAMTPVVQISSEIAEIRKEIKNMKNSNEPLRIQQNLLEHTDDRLNELFPFLLDLGALDQAKEIIDLLVAPAAKDQAISNLVHAYLKKGKCEKAEELADQASNYSDVRNYKDIKRRQKDHLFKEIISELRINGRFDQADELLGRIASQTVKAEVFIIMIEELVEKDKYEEAYYRIINTFKDHPKQGDYGQSYLLSFMVDRLIEKKDLKHAKWFADLIQDREIRAKTLKKSRILHSKKNLFIKPLF